MPARKSFQPFCYLCIHLNYAYSIYSSFWQKLHRIQLLIKSKVERFIAQPRHPLECSTKIAAFKFGIAASSSSHHNNHSPPCHVSCVLPVMTRAVKVSQWLEKVPTLRIFGNQTAHWLWPLRCHPNFTSTKACLAQCSVLTET